MEAALRILESLSCEELGRDIRGFSGRGEDTEQNEQTVPFRIQPVEARQVGGEPAMRCLSPVEPLTSADSIEDICPGGSGPNQSLGAAEEL
jgi:hypothetical protein